MFAQICIDEKKKYIKNIIDEEDEYTKRHNELRKNEIQYKQELDVIERTVENHLEKCKRFKLEVKYFIKLEKEI